MILGPAIRSRYGDGCVTASAVTVIYAFFCSPLQFFWLPTALPFCFSSTLERTNLLFLWKFYETEWQFVRIDVKMWSRRSRLRVILVVALLDSKNTIASNSSFELSLFTLTILVVKHSWCSTYWMVISSFVGRVRTSLLPPPAGESSPHTVSLNVLSPQIQSHPDENKSVYKFEAAWDSSLHNSILLNRWLKYPE